MVLATDRSCGASACCHCPYITFHSSPATAAVRLQAADLAGEIITQPQALTAGALLFGDLLQPVVAEPATGRKGFGREPSEAHEQASARRQLISSDRRDLVEEVVDPPNGYAS